jgi:hypothetical protein
MEIAYFALVLLIGIGIGIAVDKTIIRRRNRRVTRPSILHKV